MDSLHWFWLVLLAIVVDVVIRALVASSFGLFGLLTSLGHHNMQKFVGRLNLAADTVTELTETQLINRLIDNLHTTVRITTELSWKL